MSVQLIVTPGEIAFSRNPVVFKLQTNNLYQQAGQKFTAKLLFDYNAPQEHSFSLAYTGISLNVAINPNPDDSGLQIISRQINNAEQYAQQLADGLAGNFCLSRDFIFEVVGNGTDYWVVITARNYGDNYNLTLSGAAYLGLQYLQPGIARIIQPNFKLYIELWVQNAAKTEFVKCGSEAYVEVDKDGIATIDLSGPLTDAILADGTDQPDMVNAIAITQASTVRAYYLRYAEAYGTVQSIKRIAHSPNYIALLGGVSKEMLAEFQFPNSFISGSLLRFMKQEPNEKWLLPSQPEFLTLVAYQSAFTSVKLKFTLYFEDNSTSVLYKFSTANVAKYSKLVFPVGFIHNNFNLVNSSLALIKYEVLAVDDQDNVISETRTYHLDYRYYENVQTRMFVYLSSFGTYDTLVTYGRGSTQYEVVKKAAELTTDRAFLLQTGEQVNYSSSLSNTESVTSGYRSKADIRLFKDMALSNDMLLYRKRRTYAVKFASKTVKEFKDGENLHAIAFDFGYRYSEQLFTVDDRDDQDIPLFMPMMLADPGPATPPPVTDLDYRYYLKSQTYSQAEVNAIVQGLQAALNTQNAADAQRFANLATAILGKADAAHDHDDRYIPRAEMNGLLVQLQAVIDGGAGKSSGYFYVKHSTAGLSTDGNGRLVFQSDALKGQTEYVIETTQLNLKFNPIDGVDIAYDPTAGSFTILVPGFTLSPNECLIVWVNQSSGAIPNPPLPKLSTPMLSISNLNVNTITLNWGAVPNATTYKLSRNGVLIYTGSGLTFTDTGLNASTAYNYSLIASAAGYADSDAGVLQITTAAAAGAPVFTAQPSNQSLNAGGTLNLAATVTGADVLIWEKSTDGGTTYNPVAGATTANYSKSNAQTGDAGTYRLKASNTAGNETSNPVTVTVNSAAVAPTITTQPTNKNLVQGDSFTLSVAANNASAYQLYKDNVIVPGATSASYTKIGATAADSGNYKFVITGPGGATVTSNTVVVNVAVGYTFIRFGDSRSVYPGDTGTQTTTSETAFIKARYDAAGITNVSFQYYGFPGATAEQMLQANYTNTLQYASTKPDGVSALQNLIDILPTDRLNIIEVCFGANGGEVSAIQTIATTLRASAKVYKVGADLILPRGDSGIIGDRAAKNSLIIAGSGVWHDGYPSVNQIPQLYADDAPNNSTYYWYNDFVGISAVHLTTAGNKLKSEPDAQLFAQLIGITLPEVVNGALVSVAVDQDSPILNYQPAGGWTIFTPDDAYVGGYGAYSSANGAQVSLNETFYGIQYIAPRAAIGTTVELWIDGVLEASGTCYDASTIPATTILQKTYTTLAKRSVVIKRSGTYDSSKGIFCDQIKFSDANGVFPVINNGVPMQWTADTPSIGSVNGTQATSTGSNWDAGFYGQTFAAPTGSSKVTISIGVLPSAGALVMGAGPAGNNTSSPRYAGIPYSWYASPDFLQVFQGASGSTSLSRGTITSAYLVIYATKIEFYVGTETTPRATINVTVTGTWQAFLALQNSVSKSRDAALKIE